MSHPRRLPLVVLVLALAAAAAVVATSSEPQPRYNLYLSIAPDPAPPVDAAVPRRYLVTVAAAGSEADFARGFPELTVAAGGKVTKSARYGDYRLAVEVSVDAAGEHAASILEVSRDGVPLVVQRSAVWLPPPPVR